MSRGTLLGRLRRRIGGGTPEARLAATNGSWSAVQQAATMGSNSVVGLLLVLVLPLGEFGAYTYATALSAFGMAVMSGGLANLGVKMVLEHERGSAAEKATVTGLLVAREMLGVVSVAVIALVALTSSDAVAAAAAFGAAASLIARAFDSPEIWYRSHMQSRVVAVRRLVVTLVFFALRIVAILVFPHLWVFIALFVAEAVGGSLLVFSRYLRDPGTPGLSRPSFPVAYKMIRQSWPLLVSGVANQANLRSDVIVIQAVLGASSVGVYSAAARMSELAFFVPVVFMNATLPLLLKARNDPSSSPEAYRSVLQRSYDYAFWLGVLVAVAAGSVGTFVITKFFADDYSQSVGLLWILVIACPFVFMAAVYSKWIIAEGQLWASVTRHGIGAALNIALNLALLPTLGIKAAAISTVMSYIVASYLACFVGRRSREAGIQMTLALIAPVRLIVGRLQGHNRKSRRPAARKGS